MKKEFIKYSGHKDEMLNSAIVMASTVLPKGKTIYLVWTDVKNLRGYSKSLQYQFLNELSIEKFIKSPLPFPLGNGFITAISLDKMSVICDGDIVIDCFTGELFNNTNISHMIHLPWTQQESDLLSNKEQEIETST